MIFPEAYRVRDPRNPYASNPGDGFGLFLIPDGGDRLLCLATDGEDTGWQHVSVSVRNKKGTILSRCPTWGQMCKVKDLFWEAEETICQFHPPKSEYVNFHPSCLHLWRCPPQVFPLPPKILVGPSTINAPEKTKIK